MRGKETKGREPSAEGKRYFQRISALSTPHRAEDSFECKQQKPRARRKITVLVSSRGSRAQRVVHTRNIGWMSVWSASADCWRNPNTISKPISRRLRLRLVDRSDLSHRQKKKEKKRKEIAKLAVWSNALLAR